MPVPAAELKDALELYGVGGASARGPVHSFHETFIDCGQVDTFEVVKTLKEVGFDGFMITDHVPQIVDDTPWGHRGRAHCIGYMQALIQVVDKLYGERI